MKNEIHLNQMDKIILSNHSIEKIKILNKHGFQINKKAVVNIMKNPDKIINGYIITSLRNDNSKKEVYHGKKIIVTDRK